MERDKILYRDFLKGNNAAFEELVLKYKDNLIYFLQRFIKDIFTCEDIAQDVFAYVFAFKEKYDLHHSFKTYIFTIAKNRAVDHIRKQSKLQQLDETLEDSAIASESDALVEKLISDEQARLVHSCMKDLHPDYQTAIHLVDFEGMSYFDAGHVVGKTAPQFKVMLYRARKALRLLLEKGGYTT